MAIHATRRVAAGGVLLALALTLLGCKPASEDASAPMVVEDHGLLEVPAASPLRTQLEVAAVGASAASRRLQLPATVEADPTRVTNVLSPLAGRVLELRVRLGERVRRGQVLAVLASGDLAQATSDVEKAKDADALATKALDRARGVQAAGGSAIKDLEAAESGEVQAKSELDRAAARLASLNGAGKTSGGKLLLTAPQDGVVTALSLSVGAQVSDPTATLMTIANIDRVFVTANVAENDIGLIGRGTSADISLTADPGHPIHGAVTEIDPLVQPDTRRQKVRIELPNSDGRLLPNMYATAMFSLPQNAAGARGGGVFVPQSALLMNNDAISVMVEVRPWVFERRQVQIADETDAAARVTSGLAPGDRVVVKGGVLLND